MIEPGKYNNKLKYNQDFSKPRPGVDYTMASKRYLRLLAGKPIANQTSWQLRGYRLSYTRFCRRSSPL